MCRCVCRVQPEVDRKFPPSKEKKKRGPLLVAANRSSHPTVLAVRSLLLMTEAKGGRKKTIGCSLCTSNKFLTCYNFFLFFFFWLGLVFWLAGVGSFVSQLVRATDKKRKPQKKIIYKNERKREPPSIEWKEPKEKNK